MLQVRRDANFGEKSLAADDRAESGVSSLIATLRSWRRSSARYTVAMPPGRSRDRVGSDRRHQLAGGRAGRHSQQEAEATRWRGVRQWVRRRNTKRAVGRRIIPLRMEFAWPIGSIFARAPLSFYCAP